MSSKTFAVLRRQLFVISITIMTLSISITAAFPQIHKLYNPIPLPKSDEVFDTLSDKDIPIGEGSFARDYIVKLNKGDNVVIDLTSDSFDTVVTLLTPDSSTVAENDDGPDGTTNSQLFTRITATGTYIIRVHSYGQTGGGPFHLKLTRLRPVSR